MRVRHAVVLLSVALATVGCDRVTKQMAMATLASGVRHSYLAGMVRLTYAENPGAFLSLGATWSIAARVGLFTIATGIMLLTAGIMAARSPRMGVTALGLTLFVAGGLSNWLDRLAHGSVVDWIIVGIGPVHTGIFNVADVAIVAGAALVVAHEMFKRRGWSPPGDEF